ncbi:hypothetical protein niasHT_023146 [Heterodera trifolii]|uniref:Uncharacterized protein n=1 Tax=Heterodera trifolii TaxID=157864 RepID=A0ABD2JDU7_9BILA
MNFRFLFNSAAISDGQRRCSGGGTSGIPMELIAKAKRRQNIQQPSFTIMRDFAMDLNARVAAERAYDEARRFCQNERFFEQNIELLINPDSKIEGNSMGQP